MLNAGTVQAFATLNSKGFVAGIRTMKKDGSEAVHHISGEFKQLGQRATELGKTLSMKLTAPLVAMGGVAVRNFDKQAKAVAQVEQGVESTGAQAGYTSKELQNMAAEMQKMSRFGDEDIMGGVTAQILTFTNIAGEQFERTQQAALDLSSRLDQDLQSSAIQLGKALNDPISNLGQLGRAGIQFSEEQENVIKSLAESGRMAEAQTVILDELEKQYGGSAQAAADAGAGGIKQLMNQIGDLTEEFGKVIMDGMQPFIDLASDTVTYFQSMSDSSKRLIVQISALVAAVGPLLIAFGTLLKLAPAIGAAISAMTGPIGIAVAAIGGLVAAFVYAIDNWEAIKERFSDISWWRNALIDMLQFVQDYNPFELMIDGFNALARKFGMAEIPSPFEFISGELEKLKVDTKEYENDFGSFSDAVANGMKNITGADFSKLSEQTQKASQSARTAERAYTDLSDAIDRIASVDNQKVGEVEEPDTTAISDMKAQVEEGKKGMSALELAQDRIRNKQTELSGAMIMAQDIANSFTDSFGDGMANVVVEGEKVTDMLKNIGKLLASSVIQKGISLLLTGGLSGATGFFGSGGGLFGALFGGQKHAGGLVPGSGDKTIRAKGGEMVLTKSQQKALGGMMGSGGGSVDPRAIGKEVGRQLDRKMSKLGPEEVFVMSEKGGYNY